MRTALGSASRSASLLFIVLVVVGAKSVAPQSSTASSLILDKNLPLLYLRFDHAGTWKLAGESPKRLWFRFVNNSNTPVELLSDGFPDDMQHDEYLVRYTLALEKRGGVWVTSDRDPPNPCRNASARIPVHNSPDVASPLTVAAGGSLLFSVPEEHLNECWHIEIPFEFKIPPGRGPYADEIGGHVEMELAYGIYDLPPRVRKEHYGK